ncbi:neuropilin and tolloid-like protein 2 [Pollicipes pollicipes]|uniref:neuropilin and tolloid-like protein 2 n=1 Tax=Pollicipes pollicipes TaxID=41117 RepID=UPI0018857FDB|nr:neuropilin and tolloid-like protein 2 [Pollicipes pollicipes]
MARGGPARPRLRPAGLLSDVALVLLCLSLLTSSAHSAGRRRPRHIDALNTIGAKCVNFTRGSEPLKEFYSPGWPGPYPNNTDCVRIIAAPEGHTVEVDFRNAFDVEYSPNCMNDFLMVRDGKEPYSPELVRLCGHKFPAVISSSGNYLWLRFKSDDTIQYRGFRAVYTFHKNEAYTPAPECKFEVAGPEVIISTANITDDFIQQALVNDIALDCSWRVLVTPGREIQLLFTEFNLDKPNECKLNFVEILYGPELHLISQTHYCSSMADSVKLPNSQDVTFRFYAAPSTLPSLRAEKTSVVAVATELRPRSSEEQCDSDEYDCDDLYCISGSLVCDGHFNCDKQLDEKNCDTDKDNGSRELLTKANIVIMVIGCALLFGLCFSVCWNCIRKLREDFREKEEELRQSREADLDALPPTMPRIRSRVTLDDGGCYVPGVELKLAVGPPHHNGGARLIREETVDLDVETADCGCQTPAPAPRRPSRDSCASGSSTPPPPPEDEDEDEDRSGLATPRSYRSEAVIEMGMRPNSLHSAKSAPDVVVKL